MRLYRWMLVLVLAQAAVVLWVAAVTGNRAACVVGGGLVGLAVGLAMPAWASKGFTRTRSR